MQALVQCILCLCTVGGSSFAHRPRLFLKGKDRNRTCTQASFLARPYCSVLQVKGYCVCHFATLPSCFVFTLKQLFAKGKSRSQTCKRLFSSSPSPRPSFLYCGFHRMSHLCCLAVSAIALSAPNTHFVG